ncbi:MAG: 50S ribosomal protein L9 [Pseudobutyrivibrio sp.]|nr:50S ribosomal protein L9 [Pseudobutyrivibrio sp.]
MKVILLQDVKSLGKKGDVVEVNEGYARNMLFKKKLGKEATNAALNDLKLQNKHDEKVAAENLEAAKEFAKEIEQWLVETSIKTGEGGRTFGSVSTKEIAESTKKQYGKEIDKKKIVLDDPIRALGTYEVKVKLHPQVTATLRVHVSEGK